MGVECGIPEAAGDLRLEPQTPSEEKIRAIERFASQQLAEFLAQQQREGLELKSATGWDLWAAIEGAAHTAQHAAATGARLVKAAVICLLVLAALAIVGLYIHANRTLGVLVGSADAKWDVPIEPTGHLRAGPRTLEEGYAWIRLKKGAEVIVQAPSTFDLRTANRMFLESGWITATVPPAATGFAVRTPTSSVVDFGTEFGLRAGDTGNTEVHVFDGRIEFAHAAGAGAAVARQSLVKDEAITVDAAGRATRVPLQDRPRLFSRTMPVAGGFGIPGKRLGLADIVGAGNGLDTGIWGQGIDASTGRIASRRTILKKNDNGFVAVPSLPFIDGVFVPDSRDGSVIVTSTGLVFESCPPTSGTSYEAIVNGASFQVGSAGEIQNGCLAGQIYDTRAHPSIGMHPNAGITFDLNTIRDAHAGDADPAVSCALRRVGERGPLCPAGCGPQHDRGDVLGPAGRPAAVRQNLGGRTGSVGADRCAHRPSESFSDTGDDHPRRIPLLLGPVCRTGPGVDERETCRCKCDYTTRHDQMNRHCKF